MWDDARQLNAVATVLTVFAAVLLGWGLLSWLARQPAFAFREVVVQGPLVRTNAAYLEAIIRDELAGTFFTMNLDRGRAAIAKAPWVRRVALRRQWPQRLEVSIEEHVPLARWNDSLLVDTEGEVFAASDKDELPRFAGPEGAALEVTRRYREWGAALAPLNLTLNEMRLSARGGWELHVVGETGPLGIEVGRDEPSARLARFVRAYGRTIGAVDRTGIRVEQVDLRYRNGFAAKVPTFRERAPRKIAAVDCAVLA